MSRSNSRVEPQRRAVLQAASRLAGRERGSGIGQSRPPASAGFESSQSRASESASTSPGRPAAGDRRRLRRLGGGTGAARAPNRMKARAESNERKPMRDPNWSARRAIAGQGARAPSPAPSPAAPQCSSRRTAPASPPPGPMALSPSRRTRAPSDSHGKRAKGTAGHEAQSVACTHATPRGCRIDGAATTASRGVDEAGQDAKCLKCVWGG
jgi:hypothetical protein